MTTSTAPRVTLDDIEEQIAEELYFTAADGIIGKGGQVAHNSPARLLTFCVLVLRNGFTVTGEAACVSAENFDEKMGRQIARQKAIDNAWPLLGFRLRDKLAARESHD